MSNQINKFKHIILRDDIYKQIQSEGKFGESVNDVVKRILAERIKHKQGELIIS
jgi:predicted CopG family antitoxin